MKFSIAAVFLFFSGVNADCVADFPTMAPGAYPECGFYKGRDGVKLEMGVFTRRRLAGYCDGDEGNCCSGHGAQGCEDDECEIIVATQDSFCCDIAWDGICANIAESDCSNYSNCACATNPGACGDPHFKTWNGTWFDYHGKCDLVLVHAPSFGGGAGLDVHIRTEGRYDYSYISSAAIRIGTDVLEVGSFGEYFFNGVESAEMPVKMGSKYPVEITMANKKETRFAIQVEKDQFIHVKAFKDLVAVDFDRSTPFNYVDSVGLMGDFSTGKKLSRQGVVMTDNNAFGQEWQVGVGPKDSQLFANDEREPQFPKQCIMPGHHSASAERRLGENAVSHEEAQQACAGMEGEEQVHCVFDVMATGDIEVAQAGSI